ncbi:MAG: CRISPR-associated protein Cas4 [Lachnospiraceae bacterium]|nr:CRISPR-associated protein Cas4 [Lachnospiraceae bacterium]
MKKEITGIMVYYYKVCPRKLWYFYHEIQMEQENENVNIGKILDEETYKRDDKHINIDNVINIDFIRSQGILHEIKKSRKIEEASILQVKYYLYYLQRKKLYGIKAKIDYPLLKKTLEVDLSEQDIKEIDEVLGEIEKIVDKAIPPKLEKKNICKSCAYYDLCFI